MIKIIFEINEEAISNENVEKKLEEKRGKMKAAAMLAYVVGISLLRKRVKEGLKEFTVKEEKLDDKSKEIYDNLIGTICSVASFSETDKP